MSTSLEIPSINTCRCHRDKPSWRKFVWIFTESSLLFGARPDTLKDIANIFSLIATLLLKKWDTKFFVCYRSWRKRWRCKHPLVITSWWTLLISLLVSWLRRFRCRKRWVAVRCHLLLDRSETIACGYDVCSLEGCHGWKMWAFFWLTAISILRCGLYRQKVRKNEILHSIPFFDNSWQRATEVRYQELNSTREMQYFCHLHQTHQAVFAFTHQQLCK